MDLVRLLATVVGTLLERRDRCVVAVDGPDAAGKTTLADRLAATLGPEAVRASIDGFHRPAARRLARGALSPVGYYADSFDHDTLAADLLGPFAAGAGEVTVAAFDHRADRADPATTGVPARAALLVDGVFLLRPELRQHWDLAVYLHVPEHVTLERALRRDLGLFGSAEAIEQRYTRRYLPGQALYRCAADPVGHAHLVIDNSRPDRPTVLRDRLGVIPPVRG
jgi:uridine kinase